jgi:hypothetical protein
MSIFKETLDEGIQTQLQARTLVVNGINNNRSGLLPWYLNKNAWVRMTSFVNYTEGKIGFDGLGKIEPRPGTGYYKGDQLSKKYILQGGTLYTKTVNNQVSSSLRYGIASPGAVYGSELDFKPGNAPGTYVAEPQYFRQQGLRPMPGITDVRMRTIGAYGSLFETTVNFHAWDTHQLNELELLFMRPGYSVLLEWGWSQYLNYVDGLTNATNTLTENQLDPQVFSGQTINAFQEGLTQQAIYDKLEDLRKKHRYNYDGMLGYIKNFNWTLRKDGGYDCSTTLISMGEVINTIKLSTNANSLNNQLPAPNEESAYYYDDYENILLSLKANLENEINDSSTSRAFISESIYSGSWDYNVNYVNSDSIKKKLEKSGYSTQAGTIGSLPLKVVIQNSGENDNAGKFYEYLPLDTVVAIISSYANLRTQNKNGKAYSLARILVPTDLDYCLAGKDTISVLPNVCTVYNVGAFKEEIKFLSFEGNYDVSKGIVPPIQGTVNNFYNDTIKAGKIKDIYVNIDFLLNTYRQLKSSNDESGVVLTDYLKSILNGISNALGGLNNFTLSTAGRDQNTLRIIDTYYLEQGRTEDKYQFDLLGLGSICKDVSIQSQIFQEQSTIVAIAAQSRANLGDVYNSTQVYLNAGLEDRIALAKWQGDELVTNPTLNKNDKFYAKVARLMTYARKYIIGPDLDNGGNRQISTVETNGNDPHTILKQVLLRYDGEINFKALIPFKLKITLEGIGGIVVGQIFTVKQNILPKNYYDKRLGFIITQIEHNLKDNQWETVLDTQICILDQHQFYENNKSKLTGGFKREGFGLYVARAQASALLYPIFLDFLIYQATRSFIGYVYASANKKKGIDIISKYLIDDFNKDDDVTDYWKNNVGKFIGKDYIADPNAFKIFNSNNRNIVYPFTPEGFQFFKYDWTETWLKINNSRKNEKFTEDGDTLEQLMKFVGSSTVNTVAGLAYKDYKKYSDAVEKVIEDMSANIFWPSGPDSVYKGNDIKTIVDYSNKKEFRDITSTQTQIITTKKVDGWNKQQLQDNFTEIIQKFATNDMQTIIRNWNYDTNIRGVVRFNQVFSPSSNVMYGDANSLIIPYSTDTGSSTLNSFSFNDPVGTNGGSSSKNKDQRWAGIINWDGYSIKNAKGTNRNGILERDADFWDEDYNSIVEGDRTGGI